MGTLLVYGGETSLGEEKSLAPNGTRCCNQDLGAQRQFDLRPLMRKFPKDGNIV